MKFKNCNLKLKKKIEISKRVWFLYANEILKIFVRKLNVIARNKSAFDFPDNIYIFVVFVKIQ